MTDHLILIWQARSLPTLVGLSLVIALCTVTVSMHHHLNASSPSSTCPSPLLSSPSPPCLPFSRLIPHPLTVSHSCPLLRLYASLTKSIYSVHKFNKSVYYKFPMFVVCLLIAVWSNPDYSNENDHVYTFLPTYIHITDWIHVEWPPNHATHYWSSQCLSLISEYPTDNGLDTAFTRLYWVMVHQWMSLFIILICVLTKKNQRFIIPMSSGRTFGSSLYLSYFGLASWYVGSNKLISFPWHLHSSRFSKTTPCSNFQRPLLTCISHAHW